MCRCGCISCAWPASWPRSARPTCASPSAKPASCSTPRASRYPTPGRRCCTSGPKGGPRACGLRRSPWSVTPTRSGSSRSSPAATARSPSTYSPRCSNARPPTFRICCCAPPCLTGSTAKLADLLTGRTGSEQILLSLEDSNAFIERSTPSAPGSATTTYSRISCGWSCGERCPKKHPRCTGAERRLRVAIASLKLALARRRGHLAGVIEQARFLASPVTGQSDEDIALGSDLRAVALMSLGTAEAWTLGLPDAPDAERHLREGADLAREIGRPYLEVGCLAQLGFASLVLHSFAATQRRCREAIALAERHGWRAEPVIAPALIMLAGTMI